MIFICLVLFKQFFRLCVAFKVNIKHFFECIANIFDTLNAEIVISINKATVSAAVKTAQMPTAIIILDVFFMIKYLPFSKK